jgi:hypothetical protein
MRFPRHLARTLTSCADARYVGDNLVVANALGVDHPELGDRERYVLDVRNPWSDDDAERVVRRLMPHVHHWSSACVASVDAPPFAAERKRLVRRRLRADRVCPLPCCVARQ